MSDVKTASQRWQRVNLSDNKANSFFADGVQDEILTALAKVADLKVVSLPGS